MALQWDDARPEPELRAWLKSASPAESWAMLRGLIEDLEGMPRLVPADLAARALRALRGLNRFDELARLAEALQEGGQSAFAVRRQHAQALIEQGRLTEALHRLSALQADIETRRAEAPEDEAARAALGECLGLIGRAYKQLYVNAGPHPAEPRRYDYEAATAAYRRAYEERLGDWHWHGVNLMAVAAMGARIARDEAAAAEARAIATQILHDLETRDGDAIQLWDHANRAECHLACGRARDATAAIEQYLEHPDLDAFALRSTRRQLAELWGLDLEEGPGRIILPMLDARLAESGARGLPEGRAGTQEETRLEPTPERIKNLERVFGETQYQPLSWLHDALQRARSVVRIGPRRDKGIGTGFLFDGAWISESLAGRHLVLTNAHVTTHDPALLKGWPKPTAPGRCGVTFLAGVSEDDARQLRILRYLWTSGPKELDATLLEIEAPGDDREAPPLANLDPCPHADVGVNVIGHPSGLPPHVSLQDNELHSVEPPLVFYRTPTAGGSSGSPVFNQAWEIVALHHAACSEREANEGVLMSALLEAMRADEASILEALAAEPLHE